MLDRVRVRIWIVGGEGVLPVVLDIPAVIAGVGERPGIVLVIPWRGEIVRDFPKMCASASSAPTVTTLAVKSADGRKSGLLVVDYRGTDQVLTIEVRGASKAKNVSAVVLDDTRDNFPCEVGWRDGRLTLVKSDKNSAVFFIVFD